MSQIIRKLKITKVLSQEPQETHDETIYFVYFDFDGVNLSFNELLKDLHNKRCVMTTDLAEAFSSVQDRRLRIRIGPTEHVRRGPQVYEVTFSMGASKITNVETWKEELLPDEVD